MDTMIILFFQITFDRGYMLFSMCFMMGCAFIHHFSDIISGIPDVYEFICESTIEEIGAMALAWLAIAAVCLVLWVPLHIIGTLGGLPVFYAVFMAFMSHF